MNVLDLRSEDIAYAMRVDDLYRWYDELEEILIDNTSEIKIMRLSGDRDGSWAHKANTAKNCSITMRCIANRIAKMGHEPPVDATSWKANKIAELREQVRFLESKLEQYARLDEPGMAMS